MQQHFEKNFQYRILHDALITNSHLFKWKLNKMTYVHIVLPLHREHEHNIKAHHKKLRSISLLWLLVDQPVMVLLYPDIASPWCICSAICTAQIMTLFVHYIWGLPRFRGTNMFSIGSRKVVNPQWTTRLNNDSNTTTGRTNLILKGNDQTVQTNHHGMHQMNLSRGLTPHWEITLEGRNQSLQQADPGHTSQCT